MSALADSSSRDRTSGNRLIRWGPGDKLRHLELVATHPSAQAIDSQVSIVVSSRIDKYTGDAVVSEAYIAGAIGCRDRTVRLSKRRMAKAGLWKITGGGGRGLASRWTPVVQKQGNVFPILVDKTRKNDARNPENPRTKPGSQMPPLPNTLPKDSSLRQQQTDESVLALMPASAKGTEATSSRTNGEVAWNSIRQSLVERLSEKTVDAWFNRVRVESVTEKEVTLTAPYRVQVDQIRCDFGDVLRAACTAHYPSVRRVRFRVAASS